MEGSGFTKNPVEGAPAASAGAMNSTCGPFTSGPNLSRVAGQDLLDDMPPLPFCRVPTGFRQADRPSKPGMQSTGMDQYCARTIVPDHLAALKA